MRKMVISIGLIVFSFILLVLSTSIVSVSSSEKRWGMPAYAVQRLECTVEYGFQEKEVMLKPINIIVFFCIMSIPVFIAGYLWARGSKDSRLSDD